MLAVKYHTQGPLKSAEYKTDRLFHNGMDVADNRACDVV